MATPPVLFLLFNRPDLAEKVFHEIRKARPARLFISVDGPRPDRPGEDTLCGQCRALAGKVDWPCEVSTLFHQRNLGCKQAVIQGITWFFENVEEGIILEDDCLPEASFFPFCAELLPKYRDNPRIAMITGDNFQPAENWNPSSCYFSIYSHIWGWASWRRAWRHYDSELSDWPARKNTNWLRKQTGGKEIARFWADIFDSVHAGKVDTWDVQWAYTCWSKKMLTIVPGCNLISNIGFDARATHTSSQESPLSGLAVRPLSLPVRPRRMMRPDRKADRHIARNVFGVKPERPFADSLLRFRACLSSLTWFGRGKKKPKAKPASKKKKVSSRAR